LALDIQFLPMALLVALTRALPTTTLRNVPFELG